MSIVFYNGRTIDEQEARISPFDRGLLYGDGLFETIKVSDRRVHFLDAHLERLVNSCRAMNIEWPEEIDFGKVIERLADADGLDGEGCAKILVTRGRHTGDLTLYRTSEPNILVTVIPYRNPVEGGRRSGLRLMICDRPRQNENGSLWRHKSLNYLVYIQVRDEAARAGFDDGILLNQRGNICESSVANIFALIGDSIFTPAIDCGVLPGIIRAEMIKLLNRRGTPVTETHISPQELLSADEIFLTNSLMEVAPVSAIDGNEGFGCSRTLEIKGLFEDYRDRASII